MEILAFLAFVLIVAIAAIFTVSVAFGIVELLIWLFDL